MTSADALAAGQVGDGAVELACASAAGTGEDAVVGAGGALELAHGGVSRGIASFIY